MTTTTTTYRISNRSSGADMGLWAAATETDGTTDGTKLSDHAVCMKAKAVDGSYWPFLRRWGTFA